MRIIHVASYKNEFFNGIRSVIEELVPAQRALGHDVWVLNNEMNDLKVVDGEFFVEGIRDFIRRIKSIRPDVVVFHSLYNIYDVSFSLYLRLKNIPYIVEPHGGTSKENAKKSRIKKRIANFLYAKSFLHHAAGLIYLNEKEKNECVFKRVRRGCSVVPNGTRIHGTNGRSCSDGVVRFVFMARLDIVQKGLDLLFPAIEQANKKGAINRAEFHFYGKSSNPKLGKIFDGFIARASKNVIYHGPAFGLDKERAFQDGDIFILTSRYEGMPMAVLEAWSYGLPCLLTPPTNVTDIIEREKCGWISDTNVEEICNTILEAIDDYLARRDELRVNSLEAVKQFDWNSIAEYSIKEYSRLVNKKTF